jgi:hypothetical protein
MDPLEPLLESEQVHIKVEEAEVVREVVFRCPTLDEIYHYFPRANDVTLYLLLRVSAVNEPREPGPFALFARNTLRLFIEHMNSPPMKMKT